MRFEKGSMQVIVSVVFVIVAIGALGFVYWQTAFDNSSEQTTNGTPSDEQVAANSPVIDQTDTYSVELPSGWEVSSSSETTDDNGIYYATYSKDPTPTTSGASVTVNSFSGGKYIKYGSGTPATIEESSDVQEAYDKSGTERQKTDGSAPGASHGGYAYTLSRERGQMNSAVLFVLNDGVLYKITVAEDEGTNLLSIDEQGNAKYEFPTDVQQLLSSFKTRG